MNRTSADERARIDAIPDDQRCKAVVHWDARGPLAEPRRCRQKASPNGFCKIPSHQGKGAIPRVDGNDGGWCIWCGQPGRRYVPSRHDSNVAITLCGNCGDGLLRTLRNEQHIRRSRTV